MESKQFRISDKVLQILKEEDLDFIFSQASVKLESTFKQGDIMYNRSLTIASLILTSLSAIIGYLIFHHDNYIMIVASVTTGLILLFAAATIKNNLIPTQYKGPGCESQHLVVDYIYEQTEGRSNKWKLLYNQLVNYQYDIEFNISENINRAKRIRDIMYTLYFIPVALIFTLIISFCS